MRAKKDKKRGGPNMAQVMTKRDAFGPLNKSQKQSVSVEMGQLARFALSCSTLFFFNYTPSLPLFSIFWHNVRFIQRRAL